MRTGPGTRPRTEPATPLPADSSWTVCQLGTPHAPQHPRFAPLRRPRHRSVLQLANVGAYGSTLRRAMSERLQPGDTAPAFTLPDADGKQVSLADHQGRKVIVYFYPAALTPGCTKQACDFTDNLDFLALPRLRRHRHLPRQAGEARQVPGEGGAEGHPPRRPRQGGPDGLRRLRREEALRQDRHRSHPLHRHPRRERQGGTRPLQRQGHRPRRQDHQGSGALTRPGAAGHRGHGTRSPGPRHAGPGSPVTRSPVTRSPEPRQPPPAPVPRPLCPGPQEYPPLTPALRPRGGPRTPYGIRSPPP